LAAQYVYSGPTCFTGAAADYRNCCHIIADFKVLYTLAKGHNLTCIFMTKLAVGGKLHAMAACGMQIGSAYTAMRNADDHFACTWNGIRKVLHDKRLSCRFKQQGFHASLSIFAQMSFEH
jgi:hypothetical protein